MSSHENVVIVAGRKVAWGLYQLFKKDKPVYLCQEDRFFNEGTEYIAFYFNKEIQTIVPKIIRTYTNIDFEGKNEPAVDAIIQKCEKTSFKLTRVNMVRCLTEESDARTVHLAKAIPNNKLDWKGDPVAFMMGSFRYVSLDRLKAAKWTSDLK